MASRETDRSEPPDDGPPRAATLDELEFSAEAELLPPALPAPPELVSPDTAVGSALGELDIPPPSPERADSRDDAARSWLQALSGAIEGPRGTDRQLSFDDSEPATGVWRPGARPDDAETDPEQELLGGKYRICGSLGHGGHSKIFRVQHRDLQKEFALKILHDRYAGEPRMRQIFAREAQVLSLLEHPNIVRVTDFGIDDVYGAFIVMEMLRGHTLLHTLRAQGPLRVARAVNVVLDIAQALHHMHSLGIIHCDVKLENVLLCPESGSRRSVVKLIDFGLSRMEAGGARLARGEIGGTPYYMSPEQIRGFAPRPSMDIYALGVLLFELLTGRLPFEGTERMVLRAHLSEPPPSPSSLLETALDAAVEAVVMRALRKDPQARQASMAMFIYELRTAAEMAGLRPGHASTSRRRPPTEEHPQLRGCVCERSTYPIFRIDDLGTVLWSNRAMARFLKTSRSQLIGRGLRDTPMGTYFQQELDRLIERLQRSPDQPSQHLLLLDTAEQRPMPLLLTVAQETKGPEKDPTFMGLLVPLLATLE